MIKIQWPKLQKKSGILFLNPAATGKLKDYTAAAGIISETFHANLLHRLNNREAYTSGHQAIDADVKNILQGAAGRMVPAHAMYPAAGRRRRRTDIDTFSRSLVGR